MLVDPVTIDTELTEGREEEISNPQTPEGRGKSRFGWRLIKLHTWHLTDIQMLKS